MFPRPRPNPQWVGQWKLVQIVAAVLAVVTLLCLLAAIAARSEGLAIFAVALMVVTAISYLTGMFMQISSLSQQPTSGRVVERFTEVSGFTPNELPLKPTFGEVIDSDTDVPAMLHRVTLYWLYVAPFNPNESNRWFLVSREVFDAHPVSSDYDAANPATTETSEVTLVKSVPAQQREEREQVDERVEHEDRVN